MKEIYAPLHSLEIPFVVTNVESSELIKYAANGFLATKISFINEIAQICERVGGDVQDVALGMGLDYAHRPEVPAGRPRLRRLLLSERHLRRWPTSPAQLRLRVPDHRSGAARQRRHQAAHGRRRSSRRSTATCSGKTDRHPRPGVQAGDRRHARLADHPADQRPAGARRAQSAPTTRRRWRTAAAIFENVDVLRRRVRAPPRAPTRSCIATEWNEFRALNFERIKKAAAAAASSSTSATSTIRSA